MGLVTRRSLQLDKLFDQLAVDPKKTKKQPVNKDHKPTDKEKQSPNKTN